MEEAETEPVDRVASDQVDRRRSLLSLSPVVRVLEVSALSEW
jgi:hypothetical protein